MESFLPATSATRGLPARRGVIDIGTGPAPLRNQELPLVAGQEPDRTNPLSDIADLSVPAAVSRQPASPLRAFGPQPALLIEGNEVETIVRPFIQNNIKLIMQTFTMKSLTTFWLP